MSSIPICNPYFFLPDHYLGFQQFIQRKLRHGHSLCF
jgi:hypothetical protein